MKQVKSEQAKKVRRKKVKNFTEVIRFGVTAAQKLRFEDMLHQTQNDGAKLLRQWLEEQLIIWEQNNKHNEANNSLALVPQETHREITRN